MNKLKYLFITNQVGLSENANSNIVWAICDELRKKNEVHIFSVSSYVKQKRSTYRGYTLFSFGPSYRIIEFLANNKNGNGKTLKLVAKAIITPSVWGGAIRFTFSKWMGEKYTYLESFFAARNIQRLSHVNGYDRIIAVSEPYMSVHIVSRLKKMHVFLYQLDPYHTNTNKKPSEMEWRLAIEQRAYANAERIFMTKHMRDEYHATVLRQHEEKWSVVEFPLMRRTAITTVPPVNQMLVFDKSRINCLFCGILDIGFRNPLFALNLFRELSDDYRIYFVGCNSKDVIERLLGITDNRFVLSDQISSDEIKQVMMSSDILINIGNTMTNQIPSKLIEYMSTGKPIINIAKSRKCPTLAYTMRYPICLDVFESDGMSSSVVSAVDSYCRHQRGRSVPFSDVESLFYDSTPSYVASIIEERS